MSEYCRAVEEHLTRVNGGHLVRIVGIGFDVVQGWAAAEIPLGVVRRGIDQKAERHSRGISRRPLRIEFCDADVREVYDDWRRAVGVFSGSSTEEPDTPVAAEPKKRPSLAKQLDRVIERLTLVAGRTDLTERFQAALTDALSELVEIRESSKGVRGEIRDAFVARLEPIDRRLIEAAREAAGPAAIAELEREAALKLAPYRDRLPPDAWQQAMNATTSRLLRQRYALPTM